MTKMVYVIDCCLADGSTLCVRCVCSDHNQGCIVLLVEWSEATQSTGNQAAPNDNAAASTAVVPSVSSTPRRAYVGWMGVYSNDDPADGGMASLSLPAQFAGLLGIPQGIRVQVTCLPDRPPPPGLITLEPLTPDDCQNKGELRIETTHPPPNKLDADLSLFLFDCLIMCSGEILELNAGAVELSLLGQVQVLNPGQVVPFWLASGVSIKLRNATDAQIAQSAPYMKLTLHSEISIVPKPRPSKRGPIAPIMPSGPPPPIVRLRVQPRHEKAIREELESQLRDAKEASDRKKDLMREARWREWDAHHGSSDGSSDGVSNALIGFDPSRALAPSPASLAGLQPPVATLAAPHYIHVSHDTMTFMGVQTDDLVVLSYLRKTNGGAAQPPIPMIQPPNTPEMVTHVVRIASAQCVAPSDTSLDRGSYLSRAPHYVLLSRSLKVALRIPDFACVNLQKLTPHSVQTHPQHSIKQSLSVRESMQRIQNIRLKELEIELHRMDESNEKRRTRINNNLTPTINNATNGQRSHQLAEDDARLVSDAFIAYVRSSTASNSVDSADLPTLLPVPFVNGGVVELQVPIASTSNGRLKQPTRRRFFSVHFNEADLIAQSKKAIGQLRVKKEQTQNASLLDESTAVPDAPTSTVDTSGLKVAMSTSYFLIQAPAPNPVGASAHKPKSKKGAPVIPPLPMPVLHINKVKVELELTDFEEGVELTPPVAGEDAAANSLASSHLSFHELGGSPAYHKNIVGPLIRHLKSALCRRYILEREEVLRGCDADSECATSSIPIGGLMLTGTSGNGKSTLIRAVCQLLRSPTNPIGVLAQTIWIDCKSVLNRKLSEWRALVSGALQSVTPDTPSPIVIVFEDIDKLLPAADENDGGASLRSTQMTEMIVDEVTNFQAQYPDAPLALISICANANSHHPLLAAIFPHLLELSPPSAVDRVAILQSILSRSHAKLSGKIDQASLGRKTEGYTARDIKQLVGRMVHAANTRHITQTIKQGTPNATLSLSVASSPSPTSPLDVIDPADLDSALKGFVPSSLKELAGSGGADSNSEEGGWSSIGGMFELKRTLLDTFELPVRYAELFALAPLKLRSGLLLYGPSGCGKTLLASNIANKCGLNFISVKGPELLNKYIGSSEQNVRDIFQRARNAAPALLFFDEMESIVPARGGDSTGVTDRVVNQFLCELDGVEGKITGGKQLYVLGASSRPDLIDPALLRPGRLDKSLYCGMPNREERIDMMQCMTSKLQLASGIDFDYIADRTSEYTPADLQAIITNAQMSLVQEVIAVAQKELNAAKSSPSAGGSSSSAVGPSSGPLILPPLTNAHLMRAFDESKPSTSEKERQKFDKIYQKFRLNRDGTGGAATDKNGFDPTQRQKQALA